ncbi:MAG: DUF72 domain-containing protein [Deltaproteobacteria bacterium]|nr:DUF72 domain-containing protein [Deltaproteobacteria bacterium]
MATSGKIHIGTSGWHYNHWRGPFYPDAIASGDMLPYYAGKFHTVEINSSFYRLPKKSTLEMWKQAVPPDFVFAVKGSRYITHMKKLKDPSTGVPPLLDAVSVLGKQAGPLLFQLPPHWHSNPERLDTFLQFLPGDLRYAFEFRDPSWFSDEIYQILANRGAAFCIYHLAGYLSPKEVTADFVYVRLHGPGGAYQGRYDEAALSGWVGTFSTWQDQGKEIFCYCDNDEAGHAARDALRLKEKLSIR